jgi:hypothetical protein
MSETKKLDWGGCPDCGEELINISDSEDNLLLCGKCGKTFPEPALGPITKKRRVQKKAEVRFPIGKHKGQGIASVFAEEPSYLCWFYDAVDGFENIKRAIASLPDFSARLAKYQERKQIKDKSLEQRIEEVLRRMFAIEPTPAELDDLCGQLFHGSDTEGDGTNLKIIKTVHFGDYIQSAENLFCKKVTYEIYCFQVCEHGHKYKPWIVTPDTDLSDVSLRILEEMDTQMYYCGESEETWDAKSSATRRHIQRAIEERR